MLVNMWTSLKTIAPKDVGPRKIKYQILVNNEQSKVL